MSPPEGPGRTGSARGCSKAAGPAVSAGGRAALVAPRELGVEVFSAGLDEPGRGGSAPSAEARVSGPKQGSHFISAAAAVSSLSVNSQLKRWSPGWLHHSCS